MSGYTAWFERRTGKVPFQWQEGVGADPVCRDRLVQIPTGYGKTLGVALPWLYHRVARGDATWPTRLIWVLPMRVLVEQTEAVLHNVLEREGLLWRWRDGEPHAGKVGLHVLMGGATAGDWHLHPEQPAILIGTQDMLLSRALNRGYGAARARWPTDFGLLSQDALWVLDEVQLMDVGLATAAQLAAFRKQDEVEDSGAVASGRLKSCRTWAMSATVQRGWLKKSPDTGAWADGLAEVGLAVEDKSAALWTHTHKPVEQVQAPDIKALVETVIQRHDGTPRADARTLVVVNTVKRAVEVFKALQAAVRGRSAQPRLDLLHSRFRPLERQQWRDVALGEARFESGQIIVATQVIEAGVDLSVDLLVTDCCPWPALIQRLGRLARRGGTGRAVVVDLDLDKQSAPYDSHALQAAWSALAGLEDVSPRGLAAFEASRPDLIAGLYPYEPAHLLLREEIDELFDTSADLTGADLDISRFIRSGDERDVTVFWIEAPREAGKVKPPDPRLRPVRDGLCAVPFLAARDWLCGKGSSKSAQLQKGRDAWVWDYLDGGWRRLKRADLWPGQVVLVDHHTGGYDPLLGWDPGARADRLRLVAPHVAGVQDAADAAESKEDLSQTANCWQTIGFHCGEVGGLVAHIAERLGLAAPTGAVLALAGRWHDIGKSHAAFQGSIHDASTGMNPQRPERQDLAKAPDSAWARGKELYRTANGRRPGFRHELASALGLFAVLTRHAPGDHPSRLGELDAALHGAPPTSTSAATAMEREIVALSAEDFDLLAYLVASHHGKVRARLDASPADQTALAANGALPVRGVHDGDTLPELQLLDAAGDGVRLPALRLSLEPAFAGISLSTGRSWTERVGGLLRRHGPFALAYYEALLRAADVRVSKETHTDPALSEVPR